MEEPTPITSKPAPTGGERVPPRLTPVDPQWALRSGLLHVLNEATLWPLGFAIVLAQGLDGTIGMVLMESDGPLVPEIEQGEHIGTHLAFMSMLAHRLSPTVVTDEEQAAKEARSRIVLPR